MFELAQESTLSEGKFIEIHSLLRYPDHNDPAGVTSHIVIALFTVEYTGTIWEVGMIKTPRHWSMVQVRRVATCKIM